MPTILEFLRAMLLIGIGVFSIVIRRNQGGANAIPILLCLVGIVYLGINLLIAYGIGAATIRGIPAYVGLLYAVSLLVLVGAAALAILVTLEDAKPKSKPQTTRRI